jgi:predicted amidophosphoribosyltransferase
MGLFLSFPLLTGFTLVVAAVLIASMLRSRRGPGSPRTCTQCGASQPQHANFCSRCGQKL